MANVLLFYDYFDPAYKAGGPIRSLVNMVKHFGTELHFLIVTSNTDHDGTTLPLDTNRWMPYDSHAMAIYLDAKHQNLTAILELIRNKPIDLVYINGIFSWFTTITALRLAKTIKKPVIIAPRGMLQATSLSLKPLKKKVYLKLLRIFLLHDKIRWHLTTHQEKRDFVKLFPEFENRVRLIGNIPSYTKIVEERKRNDIPVFGTVALISPMKNIHLILDALSQHRGQVVYYLYGPVKDKYYWKECKRVIEGMPKNISVQYKGELAPSQVSDAMNSFDFYIQPSQSENFGHSIFEALNQGIPVIISDQTPWKGLKKKKAGWDINLRNHNALVEAIAKAVNLSDEEYRELSKGARKVTENYMTESSLKEQYLQLFTSNDPY